MTPDQLARVERLRDETAEMGSVPGMSNVRREQFQWQWDSDALSALLREREALRAALADTVEVIGWLADQQAMPDDSWMPARDAARALLTGTTARTEE